MDRLGCVKQCQTYSWWCWVGLNTDPAHSQTGSSCSTWFRALWKQLTHSLIQTLGITPTHSKILELPADWMPWSEAIPFVDLWMATRNGLLHLSRPMGYRGYPWMTGCYREVFCCVSWVFCKLPGTRIFFCGHLTLMIFNELSGIQEVFRSFYHRMMVVHIRARCHFFGLDVCVKCSTAGSSDSIAHRPIEKVLWWRMSDSALGGVWQLSSLFRYG